MPNILRKVISYIDYDEYIVSEHNIFSSSIIKKKDEYVQINNLYNSLYYFATDYVDFQFLPKRLIGNGYELFDRIIPCYRLRYNNGDIYFQKYFIIIYVIPVFAAENDTIPRRIKILQAIFKEILDIEHCKMLDASNIEYSVIRKYLNKNIVDEIDSRLKSFLDKEENIRCRYLKI